MIDEAKKVSDGAIVGSAIIKAIIDNPKNYLDSISKFFRG